MWSSLHGDNYFFRSLLEESSKSSQLGLGQPEGSRLEAVGQRRQRVWNCSAKIGCIYGQFRNGSYFLSCCFPGLSFFIFLLGVSLFVIFWLVTLLLPHLFRNFVISYLVIFSVSTVQLLPYLVMFSVSLSNQTWPCMVMFKISLFLSCALQALVIKISHFLSCIFHAFCHISVMRFSRPHQLLYLCWPLQDLCCLHLSYYLNLLFHSLQIFYFTFLLSSLGVLKHNFWSSQFSNFLFSSVTLFLFVSCWASGPNSWNGWRVTSRFKSSTSTTAVRNESVLDSCRWMVIVQRARPFFNFTAGTCTPIFNFHS